MADSDRIGLHNLEPAPGSRSKSQRRGRGRGSGRGRTSGRGHKGQKARSGASIPPWFEGGQMPLYRRTPKRGFSPRNRVEPRIVNLRDLARLEESEITPGLLEERGVVRRGDAPIKVLGDGELDRAVTVRAHAFSAGAREKIEAAGGAAEIVD